MKPEHCSVTLNPVSVRPVIEHFYEYILSIVNIDVMYRQQQKKSVTTDIYGFTAFLILLVNFPGKELQDSLPEGTVFSDLCMGGIFSPPI
jgi:hypothetical protein